MRIAVLTCLLVALMPRQAPKPSPPPRDPHCFRPLEEFCVRDECVTYAAQVKSIQVGGSCSVTSFGKCGPLRITYLSGFAAETRYFDKSGKLIAVRVDTDVYLGPACPYWQHYGAPITCRVTNVKRCEPATSEPGGLPSP